MTLSHWGTLSPARRGKDNSWHQAKLAVRQWVAARVQPLRVLEVFGPGGVGADQWRRLGATAVDGTMGGAHKSLRALAEWDYPVWDIDPWGSPFEALGIVAANATSRRLGLFLCDGCLRKMAEMGGHLPKVVCEATGWPAGVGPETRWRKRWIYHHYPEALRYAIERIVAPRYSVVEMCVVKARGTGAANYAGVIAERAS